MKRPTVTVYIPCRDYERFLRQAVDSVIAQTRDDWELIIVDDGSSDETWTIAMEYAGRYPDKIEAILHEEPKGLQASANEALERARGKYFMRLDADDYLDENALLVMTHCLERDRDLALVYPNYFYVDELGNHLGVEQRKQVGDEVELLDLPAHGACTLVRTRVLKSVGGYDESNHCQDGYELWLKVLGRYRVGNVPTPLFFYRQHSGSLSEDGSRLLQTRAKIKRAIAERGSGGSVRPRTAAIIGAKNTYEKLPNIVLHEVAGRPLLDYTLDVVSGADGVDHVLVTADDPAVVEYTEGSYPEIEARLRPMELSAQRVPESAVILEAVDYLEKKGFHPDIIVSLSVHCPLRKSEHIQAALDTLLLYNADSVISVFEDRELHYVHARHGLEPLNPAMHRQIRLEREGLFVDNGAIHALWRDVLTEGDALGRQVGHVVMPRWQSFQIKTPQDAWLVEQVLLRERGE